jgi:hypothetical protein
MCLECNSAGTHTPFLWLHNQRCTHVLSCTPNNAHTYCYVHPTTHTRTVMYTQQRTHILSCTPNNAHTYCHVHTHVLLCTPNNTHTYCHVHPTTHTRTVMYTQQRTHVLSSTPNDAHTNGHVQVLINKHEVCLQIYIPWHTYVHTYICSMVLCTVCIACIIYAQGFIWGDAGTLHMAPTNKLLQPTVAVS